MLKFRRIKHLKSIFLTNNISKRLLGSEFISDNAIKLKFNITEKILPNCEQSSLILLKPSR